MKRSKTQDTLTVIATTLPDEVAKIDSLSRQAKEALADLYGARDWNEADCARKQVEKAVRGLQTVAQQMAVVNVALSDAAKKSYDETFAAYEELLSDAGKQVSEAYDRGKRDGYRDGEQAGYLVSEAAYQERAARLQQMVPGSEVS